jgi:hypothetical protein
MQSSLNSEIEESKGDPYDTHPPLRERIEAAREFPRGEVLGVDPKVLTLLRDVPGLERELLTFLSDATTVGRMTAVTWEEVGPAVLTPVWEKTVSKSPEAFTALTVAGVADTALRLLEFEQMFPKQPEEDSDETSRHHRAMWYLGAGLANALRTAGWRVESLPGQPIRLIKDGESIEPFDVVAALSNGSMPVQVWKQRCDRLGIAGVALTSANKVPTVHPRGNVGNT